MSQTDNYNYESAGFDKFLSRKSSKPTQTQLEDESNLNVDKFSGAIEGTVKFIRQGLTASRPIQGEKAGSIYYAFDTKKLWLWTGTQWLSSTFS